MKLRNLFFGEPAPALTGEVIDVPSEVRRYAPAGCSADDILESAMLDAALDRCMAQRAKLALEHTAALSAMAAYMASVSPQGEAYYQEIVAAYAQKTIENLRR